MLTIAKDATNLNSIFTLFVLIKRCFQLKKLLSTEVRNYDQKKDQQKKYPQKLWSNNLMLCGESSSQVEQSSSISVSIVFKWLWKVSHFPLWSVRKDLKSISSLFALHHFIFELNWFWIKFEGIWRCKQKAARRKTLHSYFNIWNAGGWESNVTNLMKPSFRLRLDYNFII